MSASSRKVMSEHGSHEILVGERTPPYKCHIGQKGRGTRPENCAVLLKADHSESSERGAFSQRSPADAPISAMRSRSSYILRTGVSFGRLAQNLTHPNFGNPHSR